MSKADLLISDISGIMHEFAFLYERPVIIVDHTTGLGGMEGQLIGGESRLKALCSNFIMPIDPLEIDQLADKITIAFETHSPVEIEKTRSEVVYNFGTAGKVAAKQLVDILECP